MPDEAQAMEIEAQEQKPSIGLSAEEALWRFLQLKGVDCTRQEIRDLPGFDGAPETLAAVLRERGLHGRPALVQGEELAYLDHPTLVQTQDGQWLLHRGWEGRQMILEGREGCYQIFPEELTSELSGQVLDLSPALPPGGSLWKRLGGLLQSHKAVLVQVGFAGLCLQLLALLSPWVTGLVLDQALPEGASSMLTLVALGVVGVALFQGWIGWLRGRLVLYLATRLEIAAERSFLEHLLSLPFPFLQKKTLGDFLQAFSGIVVTRDLLGEVLLGAVFDAVLAVGYLVVMGFKLLVPTVVVVLVAVVMGLLALLSGRAQAKQQALEVEVRTKEQGYLTELLRGVGTVKAAGAECSSLNRWMKLLRKATGHSLQRQRRGLWSEVGLEVLKQGLTIALLVWGGKLILKGELTVGSLFAFVQMSGAFLVAAIGLVGAYLSLVILRPQLAKTVEILEVEPEPSPAGVAPTELHGPVVMEDVWFRYSPDRPWILKSYNLKVEPGELYTLTGPSGCGKSTILRLLAGLYVPERGNIGIGGLEPHAAKHQVLYLPQFVQLYGGSMIENLRVLSGNAPLERILGACQATGLINLLQQLPMGLQTLLPHGGGSFSGGQRQVIAVTAALASGRPLLLMDEPMANIDIHYSQQLCTIFKTIQKTILTASHI